MRYFFSESDGVSKPQLWRKCGIKMAILHAALARAESLK